MIAYAIRFERKATRSGEPLQILTQELEPAGDCALALPDIPSVITLSAAMNAHPMFSFEAT